MCCSNYPMGNVEWSRVTLHLSNDRLRRNVSHILCGEDETTLIKSPPKYIGGGSREIKLYRFKIKHIKIKSDISHN